MPRKGAHNRRNKTVGIMLTPQMYERLQAAATAEDESLSYMGYYLIRLGLHHWTSSDRAQADAPEYEKGNILLSRLED